MKQFRDLVEPKRFLIVWIEDERSENIIFCDTDRFDRLGEGSDCEWKYAVADQWDDINEMSPGDQINIYLNRGDVNHSKGVICRLS